MRMRRLRILERAGQIEFTERPIGFENCNGGPGPRPTCLTTCEPKNLNPRTKLTVKFW